MQIICKDFEKVVYAEDKSPVIFLFNQVEAGFKAIRYDQKAVNKDMEELGFVGGRLPLLPCPIRRNPQRI